VSEALIRYVNEGTTLGAVNLPEVQLRSLTLADQDHVRVSITDVCLWSVAKLIQMAQVVYIHHNIPGVLRKGEHGL
jgi:D-3-phosphoglycerate dehydrogenase